MSEKKDESIVIIGGGCAGIFTALYLEKEGYTKITILEKNDYLGGMCQSLYYDDYPGVFEMGAVEVGTINYPYSRVPNSYPDAMRNTSSLSRSCL
jgi:phytoene dehydrogenase-like protein